MSFSRKWWIRLVSGVVLGALSFGLAGTPVFCAKNYYLDGVLAYKQQNYHVARGIFERLHREKPLDAKITYYLAITHAQLGEISEARSLYQSVIDTDPSSNAAQLAREGLRYLPDPNRLDTPPQVSVEPQSSEAVDQRAVHERIIGPLELTEEAPQLKLTPVRLNSEAIRKSAAAEASHQKGITAYQATSAYEHPANYRIVHEQEKAEKQTGPTPLPASQRSGNDLSSGPQPNSSPAMTPQDMMAWQMMMTGMSNPNNMNPMMNMNPLMNPMMMNPAMFQNQQQGGQNAFQMDPQAYSTLMMNQMLQNFDMMGRNNPD